jgi:hypothetical protein
MTLVVQRPVRGADAGAAFATPTIVYFGTALLLAALICAPWRTIAAPAIVCGIVGIGGVAYGLIVARRMRTQTSYAPEFEDWLFYALVPLVAYAVLAVSAAYITAHTREALFGVGTAALLLLFAGIHNSWDSIAYHVFSHHPDNGEPR